MSQKIAKKIRKAFRKEWKRYYNEMCDLKFWNRLLFCWDIMRRYKWK